MTETSLPTALPPEPPTPTLTETPTTLPAFPPTPETTAESTPETTLETTPETTLEVTPEATDLVTETPTATSTASATPLPSEPNWVLLSSGDFEQGTPPAGWRFDPGWGPLAQGGQHAFGPRSFGGSALFAHPRLLDTAVQLRLWLGNGVASFGLRQSESGGYTAAFEESGFLRLYRGEQEVGQMFLGPVARQWRTLRLSAAGDVVRVSLDGAELITFVDSEPLPAGFVTLGGRHSLGSRFLIDDLSVWAAEGETIQPAAPAAFAAPMAYAATSEGAAGRITSSLAYNQYDQVIYLTRLTILKPDGTTSTFPGVALDEGQPWSPDGQRLFVNTIENAGIDLLDLSTGTVTPLTSLPVLGDWTGDSCASWSPNGEWVSFLSTRRDGAWVNDEYGYTIPRMALYVVNADGQSEPVRVLLADEDEWLGCPQWLDNERIVLPKNQYPGLSALVSVNRSGADEHTHFEIEETIYELAVSPESGKAAVTTYTGCGCIFDVRVVKLDDDTLIELSNQAGEEEYSYGANVLNWNPDGTKLLMGRGIPDGREQDLVIADLSQPCPACSLSVLPNGLISDSMAWSPDGQWIASFRYGEGLFLFAPDGNEVVSVSMSEDNSIYSLAWQPLQPSTEPCMGYSIDDPPDSNIRSIPEVGAAIVGQIPAGGRRLLGRLSAGTSALGDDWYLIANDDGETPLGWSRSDVVHTSPRYGAACALPKSDQMDLLLNPISRESLSLWRPDPPENYIAQAASLFEQETHTELQLPLPFSVLPAGQDVEWDSSQIYGLNTWVYRHVLWYDDTNHIHNGLDFAFMQPSSDPDCSPSGYCFNIYSVCDGRVLALNNQSNIGVGATGSRLTLRCSAPDGSNSNIYVVYNHLRPDIAYARVGEFVTSGEKLGDQRVYQHLCNENDHNSCEGSPHLHMEVYYYTGIEDDFHPTTSTEWIRLNPLLFFTPSLIESISAEFAPIYPRDYAYRETWTSPPIERRFEWPEPDTIDPRQRVYGESYTEEMVLDKGIEDYDLGIAPYDNDQYTILADTNLLAVREGIPVPTERADRNYRIWYRVSADNPFLLQDLSLPGVEVPPQVIRDSEQLLRLLTP